ncbi:LIC11966 family surface protein [Sphingobacterium suaedae]|uniref:Lipoprotein n=1 Tax=Sphingobacterium suaedae TaxID=1686402 RepID=A0ABW5KI66_9SPHI
MLVVGALALTGCGGGTKDPAAYNNTMITVINGSEKHIADMNSAMTASDYDKAEKVHVDWEKALTTDIKKVDELGAFNGDAGFQKAVLDGLTGYKKILTEDYPKLIEVRKNKVDDATTEHALLENINKAFEHMANGVNKASDEFESRDNK